jgi:HEAT repeat protein
VAEGLADAAAEAEALAEQGAERNLAELRARWADEIEAAARSSDYRERAVAYRSIGQFRFRQKVELLRRGLEDESPACRGSALISLERLSRDGPAPVNGVRPLLHRIVSTDDNQVVRRLAVLALRNGSPQRDTVVLLEGLSEDERLDRDLRAAAARIAAALKKKAGPR